jgi:hypothetical protein
MADSPFDKMHLLQVLTDESGFYRTLYFLIDRQREGLKADSGVEMCDLFAEIDRVRNRIEDSERIIQTARHSSPDGFASWVRTAEVRDLFDEITALVTRTQSIVTECLQIAQSKRAEYQRELGQMQQGRRLFVTMSPPESGPRFLDARP